MFLENPLKRNEGTCIFADYTTMCNMLLQNVGHSTGDEEKERLSLLIGAVMTLQKSSQFKNQFDRLEFKANERRMATEALVSIASGAGVEYLTVETRSN
ncbi:hypothetical protein SO802_017801 [Lithocarpus litseifolius]|uniref:Uncharacterized protein n=1 Tax=Lithocarpus litseifolius TaxID=425828 RepID=A0AAW2CJF9_9ROSI